MVPLFTGTSRGGHQDSPCGADDLVMSTEREKAQVVPVAADALEQVRVLLRAVAAGEPVDNAQVAAQAAHALAALPPAPLRERFVA